MKKLFLFNALFLSTYPCFSWGFYAHQKINYYAVFLLPPAMLIYFKQQISFLSEHAVDPDKRRYAVKEEGPRHYIDIDHYGQYPFDSLPRRWEDALSKYGDDTLRQHGIVPWWIQVMKGRLTKAFREKNATAMRKLSAEIGHYIADAHVPLHTSSNHNGQLTGQQGIHGFWESRVPELLAESEWSFFLPKADYIKNPLSFTWKIILQSAAASDSVLRFEKELSLKFPPDRKYAFEIRNGKTERQYAASFTKAYDRLLDGMIERRMQQSVYAVASFWLTAWTDAGQPDLSSLQDTAFTQEEENEFLLLEKAWKRNEIFGRKEEE